MEKIAFVVPRYGLEVNGGAELYCRQLAERMVKRFKVEILTTCAVDYVTWKDEYQEGESFLNNVLVKRFKVDYIRNNGKFNKFTPKVFEVGHSIEDELEWMRLQGPVSSRLINYIKENRNQYKVLIFIPYLYYTTYFGLQVFPDKSILISAAHDEPFINLEIFKRFFKLPNAIIYLTDEEKHFVNNKFSNNNIPNIIIGAGVEIRQDINKDNFREKYGIYGRFMIYIGRIDESKGCKELFDYFIRYKQESNCDIKLVLLGKAIMSIPVHDNIIHLGFVSDEDKFNGIAASEFLVLPSAYESLSISVLEGMKVGKPVLVNEKCQVLKGHCIKSNAGLYYDSYEEIKECFNLLVDDQDLRLIMGYNGTRYVESNYDWNPICDDLEKLIYSI